MHGRLKVKTTAQQEEEKRKEREAKLKLYKGATEKAFEKRKAGIHDEEGLQILSQLVLANPDFYTMWNFRREILLEFIEKWKNDDENMKKLFEDELLLTQNCLHKNPKSYCAWHQRSWLISTFPCSDLNQEIKLCNRFLELDERNFHCWSYRKHIAEKAKVSAKEELNFTMQKLEDNFSNYSAWHYRSSLLPFVHPGVAKGSVSEEQKLKEYELVQNAAFTDPGDQSAWFYHRWLLGREFRDVEVREMGVYRQTRKVVLILTEPVLPDQFLKNISLFLDGCELGVKWEHPSFYKFSSPVWHCLLPITFSDTVDQSIEARFKDSQITCLSVVGENEAVAVRDCNYFNSELSAATTEVLDKELESCLQLFEMEPENKWTLLTIVLLMWALDAETYREKILENLEKLSALDCLRGNYYHSLRSKFLFESLIQFVGSNTANIELKGKNITSLYHLDYFSLSRKIDFSLNSLVSVEPAGALIHVQVLILDDNKIVNCNGLGCLENLEHLSLKNNNISKADDLKDLKSCNCLSYLSLEGNPLCQSLEFPKCVWTTIPKISSLDGKKIEAAL